jgi:hypothetical protein
MEPKIGSGSGNVENASRAPDRHTRSSGCLVGAASSRPRSCRGGDAADLGLSAERIRQIEEQALEKLREAATQPPAVI